MNDLYKKVNKYFLNRYILLGFIPFVLLIFWIAASLLFNNRISFSVLLYKQSQNNIRQISSDKLLKGGKISGEFKASENYLGLVLLRFNNYVKHDYSSEDILLFKLKENGAKNWYYIGNYRSGSLENNLLFPFGFPVINESKGKIYQFEIESLLGNDGNAVEVNKNNFTFLTGYQFPKRDIFLSKRATLSFLSKKIISSFTNFDFLLSSILYLIPLIIYISLVTLAPLRRRIKYLGFFPSAILSLILLDIFLIKEVYIGILLILILGWIFIIAKNKVNSRISFLFAFALILFWGSLIGLKISDFQDKVNIWTYTFLVIGLIQAILEEKGLLKNV